MEITSWKQRVVALATWQVENMQRALQELHSVGQLVIILSAQLVLALLKAIWENSVLANSPNIFSIAKLTHLLSFS